MAQTEGSSGGTGRSAVDSLREVLAELHLLGAARALDRTVRRILFLGTRVLDGATHSSLVGPTAQNLLLRFDQEDTQLFEESELLRVLAALSVEGLPHWVAGGWGLDILAGAQTRRHGDLDLLIDRFDAVLPDVARVLEGIGYRRLSDLGGIAWFPRAAVFEDEAHHHIEVVGVDRAVLDAGRRLFGPPEEGTPPGDDLAEVPAALVTKATYRSIHVPCLSVAAQRFFHTGYRRRPQDLHATTVLEMIERRERVPEPSAPFVRPGPEAPADAKSLLLMPIFDFPPALWRLCRLYRNDLNLVPPHVTVAFPFLPLGEVTGEVVARLRSYFASVPAFDYDLSTLRWFGDEVCYLHPTQAERFRDLTLALQRDYPHFLPYDGQFEEVVPHVTLSAHGTPGERHVVARYAPDFLPLKASARYAWLMTNARGQDRWEVAEIFELGGPLGPTGRAPE